MQKILILIGIFIVIVTALWRSESNFGQGDNYNSFSSPTHASSSVSIYAWSSIVTANSGRQYMMICNEGPGNAYLGLGATSTFSTGSHTGVRVNSGSCYEMNKNNMFTGIVYGLASTSTSTLTSIYK